MVARIAPVPKRRRTDGSPLFAEQLAQSNATLQHFMDSAGRQSRWLHGMRSNAEGGEWSADPTPTHPGEGAMRAGLLVGGHMHRSASHAQRPASSNVISAEDEQPSQLASISVTPANNETISGHHLDPGSSASGPLHEDCAASVESGSPGVAGLMAAAPLGPGTEDLMRKMPLQSQAVTANQEQGLPSPAPSDENSRFSQVNAEVRSGDQQTSSQITGTPTPAEAAVPSQTRFDRSSTTCDSTAGHQRVHATQNGTSVNHPANSCPGPRSKESSPLHVHTPSPLPRAPSSQAQMQPAGNCAPPENQASRTRVLSPAHAVTALPQLAQACISLGSFFKIEDLLQVLDQIMQPYTMNQPKANEMAFNFEIGRLQLLREAVVANDWFYVVLNQLSCLRFVSQDQLPLKVIHEVPVTAYEYVNALLCPNDILSKDLIVRFGMFPAPIMAIYSTPAVQAYQQLVDQVVEFLKALPSSWDNFIQESKTRQAPPLVQDMVERLSLPSPVLQTAAFRALARSFWPATPMTEQGIDALVSLHHHDQAMYARGERRSTEGKARLYDAYRLVLREFKNYEAFVRRIQNASAQQRLPMPIFLLPPLALHAFGLPISEPQSMSSPMMSSHTRQQLPMLARHSEAQQAQGSIRYRYQGFQQPPSQQVGPMTPQQPLTWAHYGQPNVIFRDVRSRRGASMTALQQGGSDTGQQLQPQRTQLRQYTPPECTNARHQGTLFPPISSCPRSQPTEPDTARIALHQAHLRSPILGPAEHMPDAKRLYRHVTQFPLPPHALNPNQPIQVFHFKLLNTAKIPHSVWDPGAQRKVRILTEQSMTFRLRCAPLDPCKGFPDEGSWHVAENIWPETAYFLLNDHVLEPRRKLHHGRYLPIDLTDLVSEGENELKIVINRHSTDRSTFSFAVAVELVEVMSHESIIKAVNRQTIPSEKSLDDIKKALAGPSSANDDDDIVMTSSSMIIKLFDPITCAQIFTLPVRGQFCLHRDPFDLEMFLETRKRDHPGWPAVVDTWLCPICRACVAPQHLVKDGFLVEVRKVLEEKGLLGTRMITVAPDGSWKVKEEAEEQNEIRFPALKREENDANVNSAAEKSSEPAVIAID